MTLHRRRRAALRWQAAVLLLVPLLTGITETVNVQGPVTNPSGTLAIAAAVGSNDSSVANFSASVNRLVTLVGVAGSGLLALVWARVALSWFSNDITKKVQAKDRARDALVGTLLFVAALTGLVWGLARYVLTGS